MVGIPCVFTAHGWAFTDGVPQPQKALYRQIETWAAPWADQIICVSDYDRRLAISAGIPSQKLVTIHNGIPDTASRSIHRCKSRSVCITMVGRMADPKDPGILLHAVKAIPGVTVNFVGDGPKLGAYVDMSKQLGLSDRVQFLGHRSDVSPILRESDVFVLSSRYEGFPLSTLEAMREGLPTVVSDVGGAGEAVIDGVTGYLVPRGNVGAFRNRLEELVANPDVRLAMGRAARLFYEQEFTFSMMFERTIAVYQRIVERRTAFTLGYERPCEI
jgi:glycosyltransferase involved in cell wall biosynthesis